MRRYEIKYSPDEVTHPSETLRAVLSDLELDQVALAELMGVSKPYARQLVCGARPINMNVALKLEKIDQFPVAEFWLICQMRHDLWKARHGK